MKNCTHTHISELDAKSGSEAMCIFLSCICLPDSKPFYSFLISRLGSVCFQLVVSWHSFHWSWECLFFLLLSLFFSFSFLLKLLLLFFNVLSSGLCSDSAKNCQDPSKPQASLEPTLSTPIGPSCSLQRAGSGRVTETRQGMQTPAAHDRFSAPVCSSPKLPRWADSLNTTILCGGQNSSFRRTFQVVFKN